MEPTIQTIEPRSAEEIMNEAETRTKSAQALQLLFLTMRSVGRMGILSTTLSLLLTLVLRLTQDSEELAFLGGVTSGTTVAFSWPGTFLFTSCAVLLGFYGVCSRVEINAKQLALYYESVEIMFIGLVDSLRRFAERYPEASDEEFMVEADRLEEEAGNRVALREAQGMNFTKAVMWEFPPKSVAKEARDYLPETDITGRGFYWFNYLICLFGVWIMIDQVKLLGLLMALQGFFLAR